MKSLFISPFRFYLTFFAVTFAFCSLGGRLVYLQVFKGDDYTELANQARKNFIEIKARRGDIVDSKGNLLATTRSVVEVGMDPHSVKEEDWNKFDRLALLLDVNPDDIHTAAKNLIRRSGTDGVALKKVRWVKLKDEVEEDVYREIRKLEIKGVYGNFKHSRLYPNKNLASHLLGFVNKEPWEQKATQIIT